MRKEGVIQQDHAFRDHGQAPDGAAIRQEATQKIDDAPSLFLGTLGLHRFELGFQFRLARETLGHR